MSVPSPSQALDGHCSAITNGSLYVVSSNSFQSIALADNATWNLEAAGAAVTGASCAMVSNSDASQSVLYVVGGTSTNSSYTGLQRYSFGTRIWETLTPPVNVMQNRLNHSTVYLPDSNKILVYAGSPSDEPTWLSSQTFTILAEAPWTIDSYVSIGHTANLPILGQWNTSYAVMAGGSDIDSSVMLFNPTDGWSQYGTSLEAPLDPGIKGELITGSDGSKVLQIYDLSVSPNQVSSVLLESANGEPALVGTILGGTSSKRDLSIADWPTYNTSNAATIIRSDYSVASDGEGLVAFAGGSTAQSIALFNETNDGWINAVEFFGDQATVQTSTAISSSSTSTTSVATSSATQSTSASTATTTGSVPASVVDDATSRQHALLALELGVIIGVCGGLFLLFLLILLCMRRRRRNKRSQQERYGEPARMSFADRGASFMKEAEGSTHNFFPTADRYNHSSRIPPVAPNTLRSSRVGKPRFSLHRNSTRGSNVDGNHQSKNSWESTNQLVEKEPGYNVETVEMTPYGANKQPHSIIRKPAPTYQSDRVEIASVLGLAAYEAEADRRKRSSGWSKYFSASQAGDHSSHLPAAYRKPLPEDSKVSAYTSPTETSSSASLVPLPASTRMAPLNIDFTKTIDGQRLSKVASSNPSYFNSREDLAKRGSVAEAQSGKIEQSETRPVSGVTTSSYTNNRRTRSSIAASEFFANQHGINGTWTPMTTSFKDHLNNDESNSRRTSSNYTASIYGDRRKSAGTGYFPAGSKSNKTKMSYSAAPSADWATVKDDLLDPSGFKAADAAAAMRDSNITVFPEPIGDTYTAVGRGPSQKSVKKGSALAGLTAARNDTDDRSSNMTLFPNAIHTQQHPGESDYSDNTDVSWVNLGIGSAR